MQHATTQQCLRKFVDPVIAKRSCSLPYEFDKNRNASIRARSCFDLVWVHHKLIPQRKGDPSWWSHCIQRVRETHEHMLLSSSKYASGLSTGCRVISVWSYNPVHWTPLIALSIPYKNQTYAKITEFTAIFSPDCLQIKTGNLPKQIKQVKKVNLSAAMVAKDTSIILVQYCESHIMPTQLVAKTPLVHQSSWCEHRITR